MLLETALLLDTCHALRQQALPLIIQNSNQQRINGLNVPIFPGWVEIHPRSVAVSYNWKGMLPLLQKLAGFPPARSPLDHLTEAIHLQVKKKLVH